MNFNELLADYYLENRTTSQLPEIALVGIQEGIESESLLILAGMNSNDNLHEIVRYFDYVKLELGIEDYNQTKCANILLLYYLSEMTKIPNNAFELMSRIDNDIYKKIDFDKKQETKSKYLGDELNLEKMYTWYRELQDWEDGGLLLYYNNLSRENQKHKFIEELNKEAILLLDKMKKEKGKNYT